MKEQNNEYVTLSFCVWRIWSDLIKPFTFKNSWELISQSSVIDSVWNLWFFYTISNKDHEIK